MFWEHCRLIELYVLMYFRLPKRVKLKPVKKNRLIKENEIVLKGIKSFCVHPIYRSDPSVKR